MASWMQLYISSLNKIVTQIVGINTDGHFYIMLLKGGHMNIIQYLITELSCDPTTPSNNGSLPLHIACSNGHLDTTPSNNGSLPLHIACSNGHLDTTKYFITEQNCDQNSRGQHGWTFLHYASEGGRHMNMIQYLITELGCDPTIPNNIGCLPLHIACLNGHLDSTIVFYH